MRSGDSSPGTSFIIETTRNWDARSCARGWTKGLIYPLASTSNYSIRRTFPLFPFAQTQHPDSTHLREHLGGSGADAQALLSSRRADPRGGHEIAGADSDSRHRRSLA